MLARSQALGLNVSAKSRPGVGGARFTHSAAWRRKCRRFGLGKRHDYHESIGPALETLGMCRTDSSYWDVFWGDQWVGLDKFEAEPHTVHRSQCIQCTVHHSNSCTVCVLQV